MRMVYNVPMLQEKESPRVLRGRASEFAKFLVRCDVHERDGTWATDFARALCLGMIDAGYGPGELARRTGRSWKDIWPWTSGKRNPHKSTAEKLERELDLKPGSLVSLAGVNDEASRVRMNQKWDNRRKKADALEKRYDLMMTGKYHKGVSPRESLKVAKLTWQGQGYPTSPHSLQHRVRQALSRTCYSNSGQFVECLGCRKPLYRPNCLLKRGATHWHEPCYQRHIIGRPRGYRPARKHGPSAAHRARMVLMADGLGLSAREIAEPTRGDSDSDNAARAVEASLIRGRKGLDGLFWGDLFPSKGLKPSTIHKVLKDFPVKEVLEIAAGTHPLSRVIDVKAVEKWLPTRSRRNPLAGYSVADTRLALLVSNSITARFPSIYAAAKSVGTTKDTLTEVISGKRRSYWRSNTWTALSSLTGVPEAELRALNNS